MKWNVLLAVGGSVVGVALGIAAGWIALAVIQTPPPGSTFESFDDLRNQMVQRDERDFDPNKGVSLRSIIVPHPSDEILYTLAPNLDVVFQRVPVTTNSFGMRGPEIQQAKPEGVYRIILLGDSFAFGWGVLDEQSFARVLERELSKKLGGRKRVELLNFGVPGYSTFQEYALYAERGAKFEPDAVLVYYVNNDHGLPFFVRDVDPSGGLIDAVTFSKKLYKSDAETVKKRQREFWRILNPNRALQRLNKLTKDQNVELFVVVNPRSEQKADRKPLRVLRRANRIHSLKLEQDYFRIVKERGYAPAELQLQGDPHPSALKHEILGQLLAEQMFPVVSGR